MEDNPATGSSNQTVKYARDMGLGMQRRWPTRTQPGADSARAPQTRPKGGKASGVEVVVGSACRTSVLHGRKWQGAGEAGRGGLVGRDAGWRRGQTLFWRPEPSLTSGCAPVSLAKCERASRAAEIPKWPSHPKPADVERGRGRVESSGANGGSLIAASLAVGQLGGGGRRIRRLCQSLERQGCAQLAPSSRLEQRRRV